MTGRDGVITVSWSRSDPRQVHGRPARWPWTRWLVIVIGVVVIGVGIGGAIAPLRQTEEFRAAVQCDREGGGCVGREPATVVGRRTYTTTSDSSDAAGHSTTTFTRHWEVTWRRAGNEPQHRDVTEEFYEHVLPDQSITLRTWRGEVVGLEVPGSLDWFVPAVSELLRLWLLLAHAGLGVSLWGLIIGRWSGFFMLGFRAFCWMFLGATPAWLLTNVSAYGLQLDVEFYFQTGFAVLAEVIAGGMLWNSITDEF